MRELKHIEVAPLSETEARGTAGGTVIGKTIGEWLRLIYESRPAPGTFGYAAAKVG